MLRNKLAVLLATLLPTMLCAQTIDHSVVPLMTQVSQIEHINPKKYSKEQFAEIRQALSQSSDKIRVVSYNVLFNLHDAKLDPQYRWPQRLPRIVALIREMKADIVSVQEPYAEQVQDLLALLGDDYDFFPDECGQRECNGIFIKRSRFERISGRSMSMKQRADTRPSGKLTLLHIKDKKTGNCFLVCNTHLSFAKAEQRAAQAHFVVSQLKPYLNTIPIFFTGDLNTFPPRLDLKSLPFNDGAYIDRIFTRAGYQDARTVSVLGHLGPLSTFTNHAQSPVAFSGTGTPGVFLDHIYVSPEVSVLIHAVQSALVDKLYASDHFPVLIDAVVPNNPKACACSIAP
ncbi:MAG: endonuclease/exonuclease/phosphatase family protein [Pseudomonadota bacterium]